MNEKGRRSNQSDPTAERTAEQSTQTASGLTSGRPRGPEVASEREAEDVINRDAEDRHSTPRKYDEDDVEGQSDPTMPSDDSTLNTKI